MAMPRSAKVINAGLLFAAVAAGARYVNVHESNGRTQSTDDAYVQADITTVASRVSGTINGVDVHDNQRVSPGDVLATIDDRDFIVALDAARARVSSAAASLAGAEAQIRLQSASIAKAAASVQAEAASLRLAGHNRERYRSLAANGAASIQARQEADATFEVHQSGRSESLAALDAERERRTVLAAELDKRRSELELAKAEQAAAELRLSYTRIVAPIHGTVGRRSVRVGSFVNVGEPLLAVVPLQELYVSANFRETQLARVRVGQAVDIEVDSLSGELLQGEVESIGPASGVTYSSVPPHNATGNFTKITQRIPVRIEITPGQAAASRLRVGMSVVPTIRVDERRD